MLAFPLLFPCLPVPVPALLRPCHAIHLAAVGVLVLASDGAHAGVGSRVNRIIDGEQDELQAAQVCVCVCAWQMPVRVLLNCVHTGVVFSLVRSSRQRRLPAAWLPSPAAACVHASAMD